MSTISFRADDETEAALDRLQSRSPGVSRTDVIRRAILDADRRAKEEALRGWAEEVLADPDQVAETLRVNRYMDSIRAR